MNLTEWHAAGECVEINGIQVFKRDTGGPKSKPVLVVLHGFPTSSHDFWRVLPALSQKFRVILHDHPGFGLSEKPGAYSYSLFEQADVAQALWQNLGLKKVHLLAHDYGTSVATELLARRERGYLPLELRSVTLCNGSMHIELARLRILQKLLLNRKLGPIVARLSSKRIFSWQMSRIWGDASKLNPEDVEHMWEGMLFNEGRRVMSNISQYLHERRKFWYRWIGALTRLDIPCHILWARLDPIAGPDMGEQLHKEIPGNQLTWLEELGHYPMLENPELWAQEFLKFLVKLK